MNDYQKTCSTLERLSKWQRVVFCAACAEQVSPVFRALASPRGMDGFMDALEFVWSSFMDDEAPQKAAGFRELIDSSEDSAIDDSDNPRYYAMRSLGVLAACLDAIGSPDGLAASRAACAGALNLANNLDFLLRQNEEHRPSDPGPTETESTILIEFLDLLMRRPDFSWDTVSRLREKAKDCSTLYSKRLPTFSDVVLQ